MAESVLDPGPENLGAQLRQRREQLRLTQVEVAKRAGVNRATVRNAELGHGLRTRTLKRIQHVLGDAVNATTPTSVAPLAEALTAKANLYQKLADDLWRSHDYLKAIRYRGMAEAYQNAVGQDLIAFARGELSTSTVDGGGSGV